MDSLIVPTHPECDPETGAVHACGHNCQCATFIGVATAMGCSVEFNDEHGYAPRINDYNLQEVFKEVASLFFSQNEMCFHDEWGGRM